MTKQSLRTFILDLLDDDDGINEKAYQTVVELCVENGWEDICRAVESQDERVFIGEDDADELRKVVVEE